MKKFDYDYNNYDRLKISVKRYKQAEVEEYYKAFGFRKVSEQRDWLFRKNVFLTLERPHVINRKDELQILQIYVENSLNNIAWLENVKSFRLRCIDFLFAVYSIVAFCGAGMLIWRHTSSKDLLTGGIMLGVGAILCLFSAIFGTREQKREKTMYQERIRQEQQNIDVIYKRAKQITGESDV